MSKQDEKKLYEQQENRILAQSDAFISVSYTHLTLPTTERV